MNIKVKETTAELKNAEPEIRRELALSIKPKKGMKRADLSELTEAERKYRIAHSPSRKIKQANQNAKRKLKPIFFNMEKDEDLDLLSVFDAPKFEYSPWVKNMICEFSPSERNRLAKNELFAPATLVEQSIEDGSFDLDAYLAAKGLKVVSLKDEQAAKPTDYFDIDQSTEWQS